MKALTLWEPYPMLIALNLKHYETRGWSTSYRGLLAIHAAKRWTRDEHTATVQLKLMYEKESQKALAAWPIFQLPLGAVVCICNLTHCYPTNEIVHTISRLERAVGDYSPGRYAWELDVVEVFDIPLPAVGKQGLWEWERPA